MREFQGETFGTAATATDAQLPSVAIPEPRLRVVENQTPFPHFQCDKMGAGRRFFDTVVLKGTFRLAAGRLTLAQKQAPIVLADEMWDTDAPERSSLKRAGEAILGKPGTDVLVTGTVWSADKRPQAVWDVTVMVKGRTGKVIESAVQVTGPRSWHHRTWLGWVLSDPMPTDNVPIHYELAYGGAYVDQRYVNDSDYEGELPWIVHPDNPSGTGFFDKTTMTSDSVYPAPRWQTRERPVTLPNCAVPLAGLGPIARFWAARLRYAGTYDDKWLRATRQDAERGLPPDYAADFDPRFFQCAHPSLVATKGLRGDEHIGLAGVQVDPHALVFGLPAIDVEARLADGCDFVYHHPLVLDTVHIDLDEAEVYLCWRLTLPQAWDIHSAVITALGVR